jgi:hypothetical protein
MTSESAISVIMLIVKPATYMKKNVAITDVGSASARDERRAPVAHEDEDDQHGHEAAEEMCLRTSRDVLLDEVGVVVDSLPDQLRKIGAGAVERLPHAPRDLDRVGARLLADRERHGVGAVEPGRRRPLLVAVDHAGDVAHAHRRPAAERRMTCSISSTDPELALGAQRDAAAVADDLAAGTSRFSAASVSATDGDRQAERLEPPGSTSTWISRTSPPLTSTAATPSICSMSGFRSSSTWRRVTSDGCAEPTA